MSTAVVAAYLRSYNRLRVLTGQQMGALWDRYGGLDDQAADQFVTRAVPLIEGAETATARLTTGYLNLLRQQAVGPGRPPSVTLRDLIGKSLRGVDPADVYTRPVVTARTAIAGGETFDYAMRLGRQRAATLAEADVMLTQRNTTTAVLSGDQRVVGYRRVLTGESCALCATASTQRYHRDQLMPIHGHCDCGVAPIYGTSDPGQVINDPLRRQLREKADGGADAPYWRNRHAKVTEDGEVILPRPVTREHGELGPVLVRAGDEFTGPADI